MDSPTGSENREETAPFLLKLFHRTGAFHRPDEFSSPRHLPAHTALYAWPSATLRELTHLLAAAAPAALPAPAVGTRVAYRLLYHDTRGDPSAAPPRLASQELGSVVIGDGGPGVPVDEDDVNDGNVDVGGSAAAASSLVPAAVTDEGRLKKDDTTTTTTTTTTTARPPKMVGSEAEAEKTLADARFVVGDFLSVAILPPSTVDGSVQPVPAAARTGWGASYGAGQARRRSHNNNGGGDFGNFGAAGPGPGWDGRYGRPLGGDRRAGRGEHVVPPVGEWRRGERLPDVPPSRGRGRRRW